MAIGVETEGTEAAAEPRGGGFPFGRRLLSAVGRAWRWVSVHAFSSLAKRIVIINLAGLLLLGGGILYLNQFRAGLIDARVQSLMTQGEIIAGAIAASATVESNNAITVDPEKLLELQAGQSLPFDQPVEGLDFPINPERVAPILRRLISPTRTRARIYDTEGSLIVDSRYLYSRGQIMRMDLPPPETEAPNVFERIWQSIGFWLKRSDLPVYRELGLGNGKGYPEVGSAIAGTPSSIVRITETGELIVSVAVPIQRFRAVLGALLLSTQGGDIDAIVAAERMGIVRVFLVAAAVAVLLSLSLAGTIAAPLRRLADAADRVRRGVRSRQQIPDFSGRRDEIGHLGQAFSEMTTSLYNRIDAIENFAADVAHELKNPLTSLRSAVETLPLAKTEEAKARLAAIIQHDVRRLDRLISDISDASRLDAELAREDAEPVDIAELLRTVVSLARQTAKPGQADMTLEVQKANGAKTDPAAFFVLGHDIRLGQVFNNLIDNARSFCRPDGMVRIVARRAGPMVEVVVEDDGPGIRAEQIDRIFERFYTDRPEGESFGQNSGLGLSITKQIVEAHRGRIWAENRTKPAADPKDPPVVLGARFTVRLPAAGEPA